MELLEPCKSGSNHTQTTAIQSKLSTHNKLLTNFALENAMYVTLCVFRTCLPVVKMFRVIVKALLHCSAAHIPVNILLQVN